ncbi:MAG: EutN/CcmL family microcompartment protein [Clostridia bacterium]|nr:EutN/CcmL family microcompartment protein [Clostridia bacterium]
MKICVVVGHVWATKKEPALNGLKFMVVKDDKSGEEFAAADMVGAGIGEKVLIVNGSTARRAVGADERPVDAAIVGIIDTLEVEKETTSDK